MMAQIYFDKDAVQGISMWHPVDGKMRMISQIFHKDGKVDYYTDGEEVYGTAKFFDHVLTPKEIVEAYKKLATP
jgi:hypothetical protein